MLKTRLESGNLENGIVHSIRAHHRTHAITHMRSQACGITHTASPTHYHTYVVTHTSSNACSHTRAASRTHCHTRTPSQIRTDANTHTLSRHHTRRHEHMVSRTCHHKHTASHTHAFTHVGPANTCQSMFSSVTPVRFKSSQSRSGPWNCGERLSGDLGPWPMENEHS